MARKARIDVRIREYKIVLLVLDKLNEAGKEGWEAVGVAYSSPLGHEVLMKRVRGWTEVVVDDD